MPWLAPGSPRQGRTGSDREQVAGVNQEQREAIIREGGGLADLWEASPVRMEDNDSTRGNH